jgi:ankyrin repeat protein
VVDRQGRSELHYCGTASGAARLLDAGEDPGLQDKDGFTPLHFAAQEGNVDVAKVLLERGAPVDAVNKFGNTPLFTAVFDSRGEGNLIALLRSAGADPQHVNKFGQTPVGLARLIANYDVRRFFEDLD